MYESFLYKCGCHLYSDVLAIYERQQKILLRQVFLAWSNIRWKKNLQTLVLTYSNKI